MKKSLSLLFTTALALSAVIPNASAVRVSDFSLGARQIDKSLPALNSAQGEITVKPEVIALDKDNKVCAAPRFKENEQTYTVKVVVEFDNKDYMPSDVVIMGSKGVKQEYGPYGVNYLEFQVPEGTYDVVAEFYRMNGIGGGLARVIKEDLTVTGDTEITIKAADAKNRVRFGTYLPSGERANLPLWKYADPNGADYTVEDQGNVNYLNVATFLYNEKYRMMHTYGGSAYVNTVNSWYGEGAFDFYINDVSDNFIFAQTRFFTTDSDVYASILGHHGLTTEEVRNDNTKYHQASDEFQPTPARDKYTREDFNSQMYGNVTSSNKIVTSMVMQMKGENLNFYFCETEMPECPLDFKVLLAPASDDYCSYYLDEYNIKNYVHYGTIGTYMRWNGETIEHIYRDHSNYGNVAFTMPEDPRTVVYAYPGHPSFSYNHSQKKGRYGDNVPINVISDQTKYMEDYGMRTTFVDCCHIGRYGEIRMIDDLELSAELKYNGETVCDNYADILNVWPAQYVTEKWAYGTLDFSFTNANTLIDGTIAGRNETHVHADKRLDDNTAPTLQMLQMRNSANEVTDRFNTASDGIFEFTGGDFNFQITPDYWYYFDCKPMTVKVEYAPYNSTVYKEIQVQEIPELYSMPGFGYFYRGQFANVEGTSSNGWFDLKFTLTDDSGNYQTQLISPAFKIKDRVSGIVGVQSDSCITINYLPGKILIGGIENPTVDIYATNGSKMLSSEGNEISTDNLSAGIYIVRIAGTSVTSKVVIK